MSKTVLITGAAGLLGANFSRYLTGKGYTVVGIDNLFGGYESSVDPNSVFYEADLNDASAVNKIFEDHKPDYVYHFAAYAAEGLSPYIRSFNYTNNVVCSSNVINACINNEVKKIVFTSSMAVYGEGTPPFVETQPQTPEDPYGIAKYAVEMDLALAKDHFGLEYSIVRPHNVIGVYQNIWDRYRNVIGIWIRQSMNNESLTIFGDGTQVRAFSDISFYMKPFEQLMTQHHGETFNIGADKYWTINDAALTVQKVAAEFDNNVDLVHLEKRNEVHTAYSDHTKAQELLGFNDNTDLETTVREMYSWAQTQPNRNVEYFDYEVEKNLYSFWKK
jgi:UDP-glucose 4-epimerase